MSAETNRLRVVEVEARLAPGPTPRLSLGASRPFPFESLKYKPRRAAHVSCLLRAMGITATDQNEQRTPFPSPMQATPTPKAPPPPLSPCGRGWPQRRPGSGEGSKAGAAAAAGRLGDRLTGRSTPHPALSGPLLPQGEKGRHGRPARSIPARAAANPNKLNALKRVRARQSDAPRPPVNFSPSRREGEGSWIRPETRGGSWSSGAAGVADAGPDGLIGGRVT